MSNLFSRRRAGAPRRIARLTRPGAVLVTAAGLLTVPMGAFPAQATPAQQGSVPATRSRMSPHSRRTRETCTPQGPRAFKTGCRGWLRTRARRSPGRPTVVSRWRSRPIPGCSSQSARQAMHNWQQGMMAGTSPSITTLSTGGYEMAFQANGNLFSAGQGGNQNWQQGMAPGTSPSITALPGGGYEMAFQANTGNLYTAGTTGITNWGQGMAPGTSPAITALKGGGIEIAFQANTGQVITVGSAGSRGWDGTWPRERVPDHRAHDERGLSDRVPVELRRLHDEPRHHRQRQWLLLARDDAGGVRRSRVLPFGGFQMAMQANT